MTSFDDAFKNAARRQKEKEVRRKGTVFYTIPHTASLTALRINKRKRQYETEIVVFKNAAHRRREKEVRRKGTLFYTVPHTASHTTLRINKRKRQCETEKATFKNAARRKREKAVRMASPYICSTAKDKSIARSVARGTYGIDRGARWRSN